MNFFRRLIGKGGASDASTSFPDSAVESGETEPFDFEVRLAYLPIRDPPRVWKTRSVKADPRFIYILPPTNEAMLPTTEPVSVYLMGEGHTAEFDSIVKPVREAENRLLRVDRPANLDWKIKNGSSAHQKRKYLRIDVSLPARISLIVPTLSGSPLKVDEPRNCRLIDLSVEGCSLLTDFEPPVQHLVEIRVLGATFPLHVQGMVVRVKPSSGSEFKYCSAIAFHDVTEVTRDMVGNFILGRQKDKA